MPNSLNFASLIGTPECWGREKGRLIFPKLLAFVEANPGISVFKISMEGIRRMDLSFSSETIVELAKRFRKMKGFCLINLSSPDLIENIDSAARKKEQPLMVWQDGRAMVIGPEPSEGIKEALDFAILKERCRAAEFAQVKGIPIANASMKFKQLWEQGYLMRRETSADSGGVEFIYERIR